METTQRPLPSVTTEEGSVEPPTENGGPPRSLRAALLILGALALIVAVIFGVRFLLYALAHETTDDAMIDADEVQITSKIAERVERIQVDTNQPVHKGQLLVQLDDKDERQRVDQARASLQAQRAQARAAQENVALTRDTQAAQNQQNAGAIAQAQAGIESAAEQARSAQHQIAVTQAGVDAARAGLKASQDAVPGALESLHKAEADLRRTASLVSTGDLAQSQLDAARAAAEAARSTYQQSVANVAAAQANLDQAQQKLDSQRYATSSTQAQVGVQQATLETAQGRFAESDAPNRVPAEEAQAQAASAQAASLTAQLRNAENQLAYTRITSPIDGFVGQKNVEIGQTVSAGESLMTLIPRNRVYITANYKETQIGHMHVGQPVDIKIDAYGGVKFTGRVENLSPASQNKFSLVPAQNATGNFVKVTQRLPVRIVFDDPDPRYPLRPGMSVETSVKVK